MSAERFDRLESQLTQVIQGMTVMQQNMTVMQQNMTVMQQNMTVMQQDITGIKGDITEIKGDITEIKGDITEIKGDINQLNQRVDSVQGTLNIAVSEGFKRLNANIIDVSRALGENEEKTDDTVASLETTTRNIRRLNQRVLRLEQRSEEI